MSLPAPREPGRYRIELVCLGNICRSPMAHVVLEARLDEAGLGDVVEVTSSGTGDWHVGNRMDRRAAATLSAAGYDPTPAPRPPVRRRVGRPTSTWSSPWTATTSRDLGGVSPRVMLFRAFDPVDGRVATYRTRTTVVTPDSRRC